MTNLQQCIEELLSRGLYDWIDASEIAWVAHETGLAESDDARRDLSLQLIRELLEGGLVEPGRLAAQVGFVPWNEPVEVAMLRIENAWPIGLEGGPQIGEVCWLNLTPKGVAEAERFLSKEGGT